MLVIQQECYGKQNGTTRRESRTIIFRIPVMNGAPTVKVIGSESVACRSQGYDIAVCPDCTHRGFPIRCIRLRHVALNPRHGTAYVLCLVTENTNYT
jgi:hypothetical protein